MTRTKSLIPDFLTIAPRNTDDDAFRARMEAKSDRARHHRAIELAAITAVSTRPATVNQRATPTPKPPRRSGPGRVYTKKPAIDKVRPCPDCGHPTRANRHKAAEFPGTRPRRSGGRCTSCCKAWAAGGGS